MNYDVIIIGAGPGGIFAAYELMKEKPNTHLTLTAAVSSLILPVLNTVILGALNPVRSRSATMKISLRVKTALRSASTAASPKARAL